MYNNVNYDRGQSYMYKSLLTQQLNHEYMGDNYKSVWW